MCLFLCDRVYYKTNYQTKYLEKISTKYQLFPFPENQFQPNYQLHRPLTNYMKKQLIEHPAPDRPRLARWEHKRPQGAAGVAVNRSNFSGRKDRSRTI